jgi:two-component system, LytTR family, response regulator
MQQNIITQGEAEISGTISTLTISDREGFKIIDIERIIYLHGKDNYTTLHLHQAKSITTSRTLKKFEDLLCDSGFLRIHKSHIINLIHLKKVIRLEKVSVQMVCNSELVVSRRRTSELLKAVKSPPLASTRA